MMLSGELSKAAACERCHRRKTRCDKLQPACSSCTRSSLSCVYSHREPTLRRSDVESLERRIRQLDAQNKTLTNSLRAAHRKASAGGAFNSGNVSDEARIPTPRNSNDGQNGAKDTDITNEVSSLSLHAVGDQQFLGSASGMLLGKLLQVEVRSINQSRQEDDHQFSARPHASVHGAQSGAVTPDLSSLPAEKLARSLLSAYLSHDHLCYPFLHPRSLTEALDAIYANQNFYVNNPVEAFIFDMILAIGTAQVYKYDWQVLPDAETHHERAMSRLVVVLGKGGIIALQAILLLCQYRMLSALYETSASLWHLVGMAARMCLELGMHRESVYRTSQGLDLEDLEGLVEASEIKRRCFWSIFALDRIASITLGRPLALNLDDIDTELPLVGQVASVSPDSPMSPNDTFDSPQWRSRTAIFVHITRYRAICGKILSSVHNTTKRGDCDFTTIRENFAHELESWYHDIDNLPLVDSSPPRSRDRSSFRSRDWYRMLFHNGILMLYRPSATFQDSLHTNAILMRIFESAQQSITAYAYLHRTRKINYSWVTLHAVFIAGLSYIYAVRSHFQTRRWQSRGVIDNDGPGSGAHFPSDPSVLTIVNDTRACSTVLVAVSERWTSARNCHVVFGRLSDALIADVVDFHTKPNQPPQDPNTQHSQTQNGTGLFSATLLDTALHTDPFGVSMDLSTSYQDCFNDVNQLYSEDYYNETLMQVPQDWLYQIQSLDQAL